MKFFTRCGVLLFLMAICPCAWAESLPSPFKQSAEIDNLLKRGYEDLGVEPLGVVNDSLFVRRAYVNIIGRIPTAHEAKAFIDSKQKGKRAGLIDTLIESDGFKGKQFLFYAELLRLKTNEELYGMAMHHYLYEAAQKNTPYDKVVFEMLAAKGHIVENPAVSYYLRDTGMTLDNVSNSAQVFLGTQIGCAQCHDHPFEDTTQMDFYRVAAFSGGFKFRSSQERYKKLAEVGSALAKDEGIDFSKIRKEKGERKDKADKEIYAIKKKYAKEATPVFKNYDRNEMLDKKDQVLTLPDDYQYNDAEPGDEVQPGVIFGTMPELKGNEDRREAFAKWVTSPDNPRFAKVLANRLWAHAFGYGLAEPLDNWTDRTQVSHPLALEYVERELKSNGFNVKQTLRMLYLTKLFQREVSTDEVAEGQPFHFSGLLLRRMSGVELYDSLITISDGGDLRKKQPDAEAKWKAYVKNYKKVKAMKPKELVALGREISEYEKVEVKEKREIQLMKIALEKAQKQSNEQLVLQIKADLKAAYAETKGEGLKKRLMDQVKDKEMIDLILYSQKRNGKVETDKYLPASEQPQPFKAGTFPREFGAADGEVSNNSKEYASVPQALSLLNGNRVEQVLYERSKLTQWIKETKSNKEKIDLLFLAIYARYPSEEELEEYLPYTDKTYKLKVVAKAMLNSKHFLFIQ